MPDIQGQTDTNPLMIEKIMTPETFSGLCGMATIIFAKPIFLKCVFYGWDKQGLTDLFNSESDVLNILPKGRFWNTVSSS